MSKREQTLVLARRVVCFGLPGGPDEDAPVEVPGELARPVLGYLANQRATGFAVALLDAGGLSLPSDSAERLRGLHKAALEAKATLEEALATVATVLSDAGVTCVVLKGCALGRWVYPAAWWRTFGDIDLLVPAVQWRTTCAVIAGLGWRRVYPEPRPGFDERFGKGAAHVDERGVEIDLHRTLTQGPFGLWIKPDELFEWTKGFEIHGRAYLRLDDTTSLVHACVHAALGREEPRIVPLRDVAQVAWAGRPDWDALEDLIRRWRLRAVVSHVLHTAVETLGITIPDEATPLLRARGGALERRVLSAYTTERRKRGGTALATLWALPGVRARASYVRAMLLPDRDFLAGQAERSSYIRRWALPLQWAADRVRTAVRVRRTPGRRGHH